MVHGLYSEPIKEEEQAEPGVKDHLIIVGFGFTGRTVSKAAKAAGIPYIIVEANPETVKQEKQKGENIHYGDATLEAVLEHAGVKNARVLIIGISDAAATGKIVEISKQLNPNICIIAKVRDLQEMKHLNALGADEIIPVHLVTFLE